MARTTLAPWSEEGPLPRTRPREPIIIASECLVMFSFLNILCRATFFWASRLTHLLLQHCLLPILYRLEEKQGGKIKGGGNDMGGMGMNSVGMNNNMAGGGMPGFGLSVNP